MGKHISIPPILYEKAGASFYRWSDNYIPFL